VSEKEYSYEVLNPWADVAPRPLKGIAPRVASLEGKTVGLFNNTKTASKPVLTVVEQKLKERVPGVKTVWFGQASMHGAGKQLGYEESQRDPGFQKWVNDVDAAVLAVGD
jgi:hypothetical protein